MLKRIAKPLVVSLLICLALPGCSVFSSKNRRQQLAYQKYVRKHMRERQRQILRSQKADFATRDTSPRASREFRRLSNLLQNQ
jgi:hypothetical protein